MSRSQLRSFLRITLIGAGFAALSSASAALAYTEPTAAPPGNDTPAPVNIGPTTQIKSGQLDLFGITGANLSLITTGRIQTGDTNNFGGVWFDTANTRFIGSDGGTGLILWNGANRLDVAANGNVGIGNANPAAKLTVGASSGNANQAFYDIGANTIGAQTSIYSYGKICAGNSAGDCSALNSGVVLNASDASVHASQYCINGGGCTTSLGGTLTGSGSANYIPRWTGATSLGNSSLTSDGSSATSIGNFFAPIIYDSNNTGYYLDPSGASNINALTAGAGTFNSGPYTNDWFRVNGSGGIYWQAYGGGWQMTDSTWLQAYQGKGIYTSGGQIRTDAGGTAFYAPNGNIQSGSGILATNGDVYLAYRGQWLSQVLGGIGAVPNLQQVTSAGNTTATQVAFNAGGWSVQSPNGGILVQGNVNGDSFYGFSNTHVGGDLNAYGGGWGVNAAGGGIIAQGTGDGTNSFYGNGSEYLGGSITLGGNANVNGVIYAQLMYDSNNTGYYVDPNNWSNLANVQIQGQTNLLGNTFARTIYDIDSQGYYLRPSGLSRMNSIGADAITDYGNMTVNGQVYSPSNGWTFYAPYGNILAGNGGSGGTIQGSQFCFNSGGCITGQHPVSQGPNNSISNNDSNMTLQCPGNYAMTGIYIQGNGSGGSITGLTSTIYCAPF